MNSINPQIEALHQSYLDAMGLEPDDLPMNVTFERWYFEAHKFGLTPDGIRMVVKSRLAFNRKSQFKKGVELRHIIRDEDAIAVALNEIAVIRASQRVKVVPEGKASVFRATGRSDEPAQDAPRHVSDVELIQNLRRAAGI